MKMRWRNPRKEFPENDQIVWCLLDPHKKRGSLLESAPSIQIVCGWVSVEGLKKFSVSNADELGYGDINWSTEYNDYSEEIIAWMPVEDMVFPDFDYGNG